MMKNGARSLFVVTALVMLLAAIGYRSYATAQGDPLLAVDSVVFLPPAISFHERGELINPVWAGAAVLDPTGQRRMIYHGFLYPMFLSLLMQHADYPSLIKSLAILHAAATLLFGLFLLNFARVWNWKWTTPRLLLALLLTGACANYTQGALGRPESLAALILMLAIACASRLSPPWHGPMTAVGIGLVGAVDPIIGVLVGLGYGTYATWRYRAPRFWLELTLAGACSLAVFAACFLWYPYSLREWFVGMWQMGHSAFGQAPGVTEWNLYLDEYVFFGSTWMLAFTIPLAAWSGCRFVRRRLRAQSGPASPILFCVMLSLGVVAVVRCILYAPWACYNWLPLMPLAFIPVFYELGRDIEIDRAGFPIFRAAAYAILFLASLGLAGDLYERTHMLRYNWNLRTARERFAQLRAEHPQTLIGLDRNLFTLTEEYSGIALTKARTRPERADLWVCAQVFTHYQQPPVLKGFRLIENHFNPNRLSLLGRPLWRSERGCGFAVYVRENSPVDTTR